MGGNSACRQAGIRRQNLSRCRDEYFVLTIRVGCLVVSLQFDTDREIVAAVAATKPRRTSVPGPVSKWHELNQFTVSAYQQMSRHLESADTGKILVCVPVQPIHEQVLDLGPAELSGWQADTMDDQQIGLRTLGPVIAIGARAKSSLLDETIVSIYAVLCNHQ